MGLVESYNCDWCGALLNGRHKMANAAAECYLSIKGGQITAELYDPRTQKKSFLYLTSGRDLLTFCDPLCFEAWYIRRVDEVQKQRENTANHGARDFYTEKYTTKTG